VKENNFGRKMVESGPICIVVTHQSSESAREQRWSAPTDAVWMLAACWAMAAPLRVEPTVAKEVHRDHSARAQVHLQTHDATRIASYVSGLAGVKFVVLQGGG